jgi:FixJ family two-component response regulator
MESPATLAVVDDDDHVRDSLRAVLVAHGFAVVDFPRAVDFLQWDDQDTVGCLLLDVHMPDMSGLEMLASLRASHYRCPAILLTGGYDSAIVERAGSLTVTAVLEKPVSPAALLAAVNLALAS